MKRLLLLFFLLFHSALSYCQKTVTSSKHIDDNGSSLLWKIEKEGQPVSYLFGTIHAICAKDYFWTQQMANALKATNAVCFEMNLNDPDLPMKIARGLMETGNKTLADYFTPAQYARLKKYALDSLHVSIEQYAKMKPFAIQSLFITQITNCDSMVSFEDNILKDALNQDKNVLGLETAEEQIRIVNSMSTDSIVKFIMDKVDQKAAASDEDKLYEQLIQAYKKQNLPLIDSIIASSSDVTDLKGELLDERNIKWMAAMRPMMKTQSVFFAVGAGHLWGQNGVISLLKMLGYTLSPVYSK